MSLKVHRIFYKDKGIKVLYMYIDMRENTQMRERLDNNVNKDVQRNLQLIW